MIRHDEEEEDYFLGLEVTPAVINQDSGSGGVFWSRPRLVKYYDYEGRLLRELMLEPSETSTPRPVAFHPDTGAEPPIPGEVAGHMWGVVFKHGPDGEIVVLGGEAPFIVGYTEILHTVTGEHLGWAPNTQQSAFSYHLMVFNEDGSLRWYQNRLFSPIWGATQEYGNTHRLPGLAVSDEDVWVGWQGLALSGYHEQHLDRWRLTDGIYQETVSVPDHINRRIIYIDKAALEVGASARYLYILARAGIGDPLSDTNLYVYAYDIPAASFIGPLIVTGSMNLPGWFGDPFVLFAGAPAEDESGFDATFNISLNEATLDDLLDVDRQMISIEEGLASYTITEPSDDGHRPGDVLKTGKDGEVYAVAGPHVLFGTFASESALHGWTTYMLRRHDGGWEDVGELEEGASLRAFTSRHPAAPREI